MMTSLIKINNVSKHYYISENIVKALNEISIKVNEKDYLALMGTSGSGKSTLMNIIGCLDSPTNGSYFLKNQNISELNDNTLAKIRNKEIGFVFQAFNLLSRMTALENVELPLIYAGINKNTRQKMAKEALEKVNLSNRLHHTPNELSGGQKQRVAIARAIVNNPSIILADEPTGNLDSENSLEIMKIFESIHANGNTIILVTHEKEIAKNAKRIIFLKDGKIIKDTNKK